MVLKKTLINLRKTKNSFFNLKRGDVIFFDIYKNNLFCESQMGKEYTVTNSKFLNKHFIDWNWYKKSTGKLIKTTSFNFWFDFSYDVPFHYNYNKYYQNNNLIFLRF
jgi:hypothetical protein